MKTLDEATDEMNELLAAAEERLRGLRFGVEAAVELTPQRALHFRKCGNVWGLFVVGDTELTPLLKASRDTRIMAAAVLPTLDARLRKNRDEMADEVANASRRLRAFLYPVGEAPQQSATEETKG